VSITETMLFCARMEEVDLPYSFRKWQASLSFWWFMLVDRTFSSWSGWSL